MSCNCYICQRHKRYASILEKMEKAGIEESDIDFLREIEETLDNVEFDLEWITYKHEKLPKGS